MNDRIEQDARQIAESNLNWNELDGKTIFITGSTGFIGSALIRGLLYRVIHLGENIKIVAFVRSKKRAEEVWGEYINQNILIFCIGDVCKSVTYEGKVDYIIHCASHAAPEEYANDPVGTMKINFLGTMHLLDFAKEKNVKKFLYVSTIEIYGITDFSGERSEQDYGVIPAEQVRSCYPISKKSCETMVISYGVQYHLPVSIGRLSYIFGAGMKKTDSKIVAVLARAAADRKELVLKSRGEQRRSYTYIVDAVTGLFTILFKGKEQEAYNISSSFCITTIAGIGKTLEKLYAEEGVKLCFALPTEEEKKKFSPIQDAILSNQKLKQLGWEETVDLEDGLKRMVESIRLSSDKTGGIK